MPPLLLGIDLHSSGRQLFGTNLYYIAAMAGRSKGRMLLERLDAAQKFLGSLATQPASLDVARPMQMKALLTMIENCSFSLEEQTEANVKLTSCTHWLAEEKSVLISAIVKRNDVSVPFAPVVTSRRALQDYSCVAAYLPAKLWDLLCSETAEAKKLEALLTFACHLGLRVPSEGTTQLISAVFMLCHLGTDGFDRLTPTEKMNTYRAVKCEFKRVATYSGAAVVHVPVLPVDPEALKTQSPSIYRTAFEHGPPVDSKLTLQELRRAVSCIPMRTTRSDASSSRPGAIQLEVQPQMQMHGFVSLMQQFMQCAQRQPPAIEITRPHRGEEMLPAGGVLMLGDSSHGSKFRRSQSMLLDQSAEPLESQTLRSPQESPDHQAAQDTAASRAQDIAGAVAKDVAPAPTKNIDDVAAAMIQAMAAKTKAKEKEKERREENDTSKKKVKPEPKQKPKQKAKHEPKTEPKVDAKRKHAEVAQGAKKPHFAHESSRNQYMCRTGLSGSGQNTGFKYDAKNGSQQSALAKATAWVKAELKKQGY